MALPRSTRGVVVAYLNAQEEGRAEHERVTLLGFLHGLAGLLGDDVGGMFDPAQRYEGHVYYVPVDTLTRAQAAALGIRGADDLFGGVVPHAFVSTKAVTHPLVAPEAAALPGWNSGFADQVGDAVLMGYTAFAVEDVRRAAHRMLGSGPVRLKPVRASGGHGQVAVQDAAQLEQALAAFDAAEVAGHGLVLEEDLAEVQTYSVGQLQVGELEATYWGTQKLTRDNSGRTVFGGSDLRVVRGDFDALLAEVTDPVIRRAVEQARRYDSAVRACYPGFLATRCNYDVVIGRDARGQLRSGVLEQSWRVGGATGPELAALQVLRDEPGRTCVRASCVEAFGPVPEPPAHATVYFRGDDPRLGPLTKYTVVVEDDVDAG